MLHKCANPVCPTLFRSLHQGKLFLLETDRSDPQKSRIASTIRKGRTVRRMERYWLCDDCSSRLTLTFQRGRGMVTVPLPARNTLPAVVHLTPMQPATKSCRADLKGAL